MKARTRSTYLPTGIGNAAERGLVPAAPGMGVARRTRHKYVRATPLRAVSPLRCPVPLPPLPVSLPPPPPSPQTLRNPRERSVGDVRKPTSPPACNVSDRSQLNRTPPTSETNPTSSSSLPSSSLRLCYEKKENDFLDTLIRALLGTPTTIGSKKFLLKDGETAAILLPPRSIGPATFERDRSADGDAAVSCHPLEWRAEERNRTRQGAHCDEA